MGYFLIIGSKQSSHMIIIAILSEIHDMSLISPVFYIITIIMFKHISRKHQNLLHQL